MQLLVLTTLKSYAYVVFYEIVESVPRHVLGMLLHSVSTYRVSFILAA